MMDASTEPDLIKSSPQVGNIVEEDFGPNLIHLRVTQQVKELQTVIRDKCVNQPHVLSCVITLHET